MIIKRCERQARSRSSSPPFGSVSRVRGGNFQRLFQHAGWTGAFPRGAFGVRHYCAIGLNAKEANNEGFADQVMELLPLYACKERVVAIGEIGFDEMTRLEENTFERSSSSPRNLTCW
jgi:predicted metal-dependent TIM-barrel fold hydrolase